VTVDAETATGARASGTESPRNPRHTRRRQRRRARSRTARLVGRAAWPVLSTVLLLAVLVLTVFPTRTFLAQRNSIERTEEQLAVLRAANGELSGRIAALSTDAEIERLAREQYNLVKPGERAFAVLPAPPPKLTLPDHWLLRRLLPSPDRAG
jgi:cell division protein FtsB